MSRPEVLSGPTRQVNLENGQKLFVTINDMGGKPYECFIRYDDPKLYEWVNTLTIFITRLLRAGTPMEVIASEMLEVFCPEGGYFANGEQHHGIVAHIGHVLEDYTKNYTEVKCA